MTVPGYPDYQRLSLAAGVLLGSFVGDVTGTSTVFKGYVGNWQALNSHWDSQNKTSLAYYYVEYTYYSDDTFTTIVGSQFETRSSQHEGFSQHVPISAFVWITIIYLSGAAAGNQTYFVYGAQAATPVGRLASVSKPLLAENNAVGANGVVTTSIGTIVPGWAHILIQASVAGVIILLQYYDPSVTSYITFSGEAISGNFNYQHFNVILPDAPVQVQYNGVSVAVTTVFALTVAEI